MTGSTILPVMPGHEPKARARWLERLEPALKNDEPARAQAYFQYRGPRSGRAERDGQCIRMPYTYLVTIAYLHVIKNGNVRVWYRCNYEVTPQIAPATMLGR